MSQASYRQVAIWLTAVLAATRAGRLRWTRYMTTYTTRTANDRLRVEITPTAGPGRPWRLRVYAPTGTELVDLTGGTWAVRRTRIPALMDQLIAELPTAP